MEAAKLRKAICDLRGRNLKSGQSVQYEIISGSMRFLISKGDEIVVRKTDPDAIRRGDIIVWFSPGPGAMYPTAHRVVRRQNGIDGYRYLTKGDFGLRTDSRWVPYNDVIGVVAIIRKKSLAINIPVTIAAGKLLSVAIGAISGAVAGCLYLGRQAAKGAAMVLPESGYIFNGGEVLVRSSTGIHADDWVVCHERAAIFLRDLSPDCGCVVADAQPEGGFSDEALSLIRRGVPVSGLNIDRLDDPGSVRFDYIIAARISALYPGENERYGLYEYLKRCLKPGGVLLVTHIRTRSCGLGRCMRRSFWKGILGDTYHGPIRHQLLRNGQFIRDDFTEKDFERETHRVGFGIRRSCNDSRVLVTELEMTSAVV